MNGLATQFIPKYVMNAYGRDVNRARVPGQKIDERRSVSTARIVLSVQYDGSFRFLSLNPVDIRGDSAEWFGYDDGIPCSEAPTMLDVIAQAHEYIYGDDFNDRSCREYLEVDEDGILRRILGVPGLYTCYVVNGHYTYDADSVYGRWGFRGLGYRETAVSDLDVVEIFGFQDSIGLDYYTYFLNPDGSWLRTAQVAAGEPITMQHEGYLYVIGGPYRHIDRIEQRLVAPIPESNIAVVDPLSFDLIDVKDAVTDEKGFVTFSLDEPGGYYITAYDGIPPRNRANLSLPCLPVIVS